MVWGTRAGHTWPLLPTRLARAEWGAAGKAVFVQQQLGFPFLDHSSHNWFYVLLNSDFPGQSTCELLPCIKTLQLAFKNTINSVVIDHRHLKTWKGEIWTKCIKQRTRILGSKRGGGSSCPYIYFDFKLCLYFALISEDLPDQISGVIAAECKKTIAMLFSYSFLLAPTGALIVIVC